MPPFRPANLKSKVKERLRDARFVMREMRPQQSRANEGDVAMAPHALPSVEGLTRAVADFSDTALQTLETMAIGLLSTDAKGHFGEARASSLARYFGTGKAASEGLFARESYFAAKQILRAAGYPNARLSEELFAAAHRRLSRDGLHHRWNDRDAPAPLDAIAADAAALALAILQARPVQAPAFLEQAGTAPRNANLAVAAAIGLATGVATHHGEALSPDEPVYAGVCAAVDARYAMIETAVAAKDAPIALARVFAGLIPHLP